MGGIKTVNRVSLVKEKAKKKKKHKNMWTDEGGGGAKQSHEKTKKNQRPPTEWGICQSNGEGFYWPQKKSWWGPVT